MKNKIRTVELFSGGQSFSKVMRKHGHRTFTVDVKDIVASDGGKTDLVKDILDVSIDDFPYVPHIIWASPPCTVFSPASMHHYWDGGVPKPEHVDKIATHIQYITHVMGNIIGEMNTEAFYFFIENPVGKMRQLKIPRLYAPRKEITYCQYGEERMKPTDIWTNADWWKPRRPCKRGDQCHIASPGGKKVHQYTLDGEEVRSVGGVDGRGNNFKTTDKLERAAIPAALFEEILEQFGQRVV